VRTRQFVNGVGDVTLLGTARSVAKHPCGEQSRSRGETAVGTWPIRTRGDGAAHVGAMAVDIGRVLRRQLHATDVCPREVGVDRIGMRAGAERDVHFGMPQRRSRALHAHAQATAIAERETSRGLGTEQPERHCRCAVVQKFRFDQNVVIEGRCHGPHFFRIGVEHGDLAREFVDRHVICRDVDGRRETGQGQRHGLARRALVGFPEFPGTSM
jgi:hypothetical protein